MFMTTGSLDLSLQSSPTRQKFRRWSNPKSTFCAFDIWTGLVSLYNVGKMLNYESIGTSLDGTYNTKFYKIHLFTTQIVT